jgi:hypothetical protein
MTVLIRPMHLRAAGYCMRGTKAFCQRHGIDWHRFIKEGVPENEVAATNDAMANKLIEVARGQGHHRV